MRIETTNTIRTPPLHKKDFGRTAWLFWVCTGKLRRD